MIRHDVCIACGGKSLHKVLDLGDMPSANNLVMKEELGRVASYPLAYYWCEDCSLLQQKELVPREQLFGEFYAYMTSVNKEQVEHYREEAEELGKRLAGKDFAVVIASNDGTEIKMLREVGKFKKVIGVEPSRNLAKIANDNGLDTIADYFGEELAKSMVKEHGKADLIVANNVFAHIPDPNDMIRGMKALIKPAGTIAIEVHWLNILVKELEIESLYAEHHYVWTVKAMDKFAKRHGLALTGVTYMPKIQGGSLRFWLNADGKSSPSYMEEEEATGLYSLKTMGKLQARADERRKKLTGLIERLNREGKSVAIWSVPAKISTLLNFCGITSKGITCAYEVAPTKVGRYIPKSEIPIKDEKLLPDDMPDYLIIGAWNYIDFARKHLDWYTKRGGKLINPLDGQVF